MKDRTYFEIGATFPIVYISQFFTLSTLSKFDFCKILRTNFTNCRNCLSLVKLWRR